MRIGRVAFFAMAASLIGMAAHATVVFDNLSNSSGFADTVASSGAGPLGGSFTTPVGGLNLSELTLQLGGGISASNLAVTLYKDLSSGGPGPDTGSVVTTIATVADSTFAGMAFYKFALPTPVSLDPSTRYWVVLSASASDVATGWYYANDASGTNTAGEYTYANYLGANGFGPNVIANDGWGPYVMCVADGSDGCSVTGAVTVDTSNNSPVPEPSSLVIIGVSLLGMAVTRWCARG